jgi:hypothetical protein
MKQHLMLDESSVADGRDLQFHLNPAQKYGGNPVLSPGRPQDWDGLQIEWPGTVLFDPVDRMYRCWYSGFEAVQHSSRKWRLGYAESADGFHWVKPRLGQVEHRGQPTNQIAEPPGTFAMSTVFFDPSARDGGHRFLGLWMRIGGEDKDWTHQKVLARSRDGITWETTGEPIWSSFYDISQVLFEPGDPDPDRRVKLYAQAYYAPKDLRDPHRPRRRPGDNDLVRSIAFLHGADLESIQEPEAPLALGPERGIDDENHFAAVRRVGDHYLMLFESDRFAADPLSGDLRLAVSDDGHHFRRVHAQTPVVPTGEKGSWDENLLVTTTAGMIEVGDEIRIYYFGSPSVYRCWPPTYAETRELRGSLMYPTHLGLAALPRDRYCYASGPGLLMTHPFEVGEDGVWVNSDGESNRFSLRRLGGGSEVAVGEIGRERRQSVYRRIVWNGEVPEPGTYELHVELARDGRLYSFAA